jgi:hypothetical protein
LRLGVSAPGADQFLSGQIVLDPADRGRLARLVVYFASSPASGEAIAEFRRNGFTPPIGSNKGS